MPLGSPYSAIIIFITTTLVILSTATVVDSVRCKQGKEYWDSAQDTCINCTRCSELHPKGQQIVIRPCEVHRDTLCGSLKDLELDWSWMRKFRTPKPTHHHHHKHHHHHQHQHTTDSDEQQKKHHHHHRRKHHRVADEPTTESNGVSMVWRVPDDENNASADVPKFETDSPGPAGVDGAVVRDVVVKDDPVVYDSSVGVDGPEMAETFIWDWQAIVLAMAVCACILFFVVAAIYSVHHARQWKRLKENFEADVEELSARLGLMVATGEINSDVESNRPTSNENYHNNQCVYLEQLLVRKDTKSGPKIRSNLYIEEANTGNTSGVETDTQDPK